MIDGTLGVDDDIRVETTRDGNHTKFWLATVMLVRSGGFNRNDLDEDISIENLLLGRRSGESPDSFQRWLDLRNASSHQS